MKDSIPRVVPTERGICFRSTTDDHTVAWGEIASVNALRMSMAEGTPFIELYIEHYSGVDFRVHSIELEFYELLVAMAMKLQGFDPQRVHDAPSPEELSEREPLWSRDEDAQPFEFEDDTGPDRNATYGEMLQMQAAHASTVASCEHVLGRSLTAEETACISVRFDRGEIHVEVEEPLTSMIEQAGGFE